MSQFGWQDPNHEWEEVGAFTVIEVAHQMTVPFVLKQCRLCGAFMTDHGSEALGRQREIYETPRCTAESGQRSAFAPAAGRHIPDRAGFFEFPYR